ncbi:amino acid permease [bacterium]
MKIQKALVRQLNGLDVFCISSGAMISSGLFILPGIIYTLAGPSIVLGYFLAGLLFVPALFAKIELSTAMPKAGGSYFFIERSMGTFAGILGGFASWFSLSLKSAFALAGIGAFATLINPNLNYTHIKIISLIFCAFFTVVNILSVKLTGKLQNVMVLFLLSILSIYILRGWMVMDLNSFKPFFAKGGIEFFNVVGLIFVSFGGLTKAASVAEEVKNPQKNITYGMISSFFVVLIFYVFSVFVTVGVLSSGELSNSLTPLSLAGLKLFGTPGSIILAIGAVFAFISTVNSGILASSRFPIAMSRDNLLPRIFASINKRSTPYFSIIITGLFMAFSILFLSLEDLVKVASSMKIVLFILIITASILMRESKILNYKPYFKAPFYPWMHLAGILSYFFLLYKMGTKAIIAVVSFLIVTTLWYKLYVREKSRRKSALIHIIESITAKEIAGESLGKELREVLKKRDEIGEDRFDKLVKKSEIIDIPKQLTANDFFVLVSEKLAAKLNVDKEKLKDQLIAREEESTTAIRPGLAIPHITIDGEHNFEILIARCESGIVFSSSLPPVYAVFVLAGTLDERNFHLRTLAAIAQIVQDLDFDKDWLRAKNIEELRDIILLSKRRR